LWPASIASAVAYRRELPADRRLLGVLGVASALGGFLGAVLLLETRSSTFAALVPWLLLAASLVFTFRVGGIPALLQSTHSLRSRERNARDAAVPLVLTAVFQLAIGTYGGYFGGGMGI